MPPEKDEHGELRELMQENQRLLTENNEILKKMYRAALVSFWLRVIVFMIIIGVPVFLYYYVVDPYVTTIGSSLGSLNEGLETVPGWETFRNSLTGESTDQ